MIFNRMEDPLSNQDLSGLCLSAQPGRKVSNRANRGVVEPPFVADTTQCGEALGYPYAEAEIMAEPAPAVDERCNSVTHS